MRKYVTEFIGTFFLVLTIGLTVVGGVEMAPLAIGASLMIMVYMGGHISGAHYTAMRGALGKEELLPYWISQIAGALTAGFVTSVILGGTVAIAPGNDVSMISALLVEILYTFALALVVLNCATSKGTEGNSFYGLAIGFTIVVAAFAGGGISGGAFNPAVGIGHTIADMIVSGGSIANIWLYLVGPLAGGAIAQSPTKRATPVLRAGLTDVLVTGMLIR